MTGIRTRIFGAVPWAGHVRRFFGADKNCIKKTGFPFSSSPLGSLPNSGSSIPQPTNTGTPEMVLDPPLPGDSIKKPFRIAKNFFTLWRLDCNRIAIAIFKMSHGYRLKERVTSPFVFANCFKPICFQLGPDIFGCLHVPRSTRESSASIIMGKEFHMGFQFLF